MLRKAIALFTVFFIILFCTGCWNNRDLTEMAISTGIGIDKTDDGRFMVSTQIVKPSAAKISSNEGKNGGSQKSFVVVSSTADTVFGAIRGMLSRVNEKIFYSSSQAIVIGENAARSGISDFLDFLQRDHETQYKTHVLVTKDITAKEILEQEYVLSNIPGAFIADTIENTSARAFLKPTMLIELVKELSSMETQVVLGTIYMKDNTTDTEGAAVFLKDKMVGWLNRFETRGYMFIAEKIKSTILEIPNPEAPDKMIGIELISSSSKISLEHGTNGRVAFSVVIKPRGNIGEQNEDGSLEQPEFIEKLVGNFNREVENEVLGVIKKCQKEYKSDIFGFGSVLHKKNPGYWQKMKDDWNEKGFANASIRIKVDSELLRTGLVKEPVVAR